MTTSRRTIRLIVMIAAYPLLNFSAVAVSQTESANLPLFSSATPLQITLEAPLRALRRDSRSRPERDGLVKFVNSAGEEVPLEVEVRVRGKSRLAECDFPPLRLDFRRGQLEGTVFAGQNQLKLVTLCKSRDSYRDYLHIEHDIYRLLNELTDYSFRVRRVDVEYVSTDSRREEISTDPAFFIEEDWEVAARHGRNVVEQERVAVESLDPSHTALLSIFQFMIGNTDWSALRGPEEDNCCHNGKLIGAVNSAPIVLPYDFDQAGIIYTEYSQPSDRLPIRTVRERLYRGFCALNPNVEAAIDRVVARRGNLEGVLQASEASEKARMDALEYLQESIELLLDPETRTQEILESCRG